MTFGQRVLGCMIKVPLGCLAFLIGAGVVFVIFLPAAGGRVLTRLAEERFAAQHAGTLEINEAWLLSFYGPQRIEGLSLRDPDGNEVLHASLVAPRLELDARGAYGPIEIRVDRLELVEDERGATNLGRALALRDPARAEPVRIVRTRDGLRLQAQGLGFDVDAHSVALSLAVERWSWTAAGGLELLLRDLTVSGEVAAQEQGVRLELSGRGILGAGSEEDAIFRWTVEHLERLGMPGESTGSRLELDLSAPPLAALAVFFPGARELAPVLGDPVEHVRLILSDVASPGALAGARLELQVDSRGTRLVAAGALDLATRRLTGTGEAARVEFAADSWWTTVALPALLPLADAPEIAGERGRLVLEDPALSLRGGFAGLSTRARLEGEALSFALPQSLRAELGSGRARQALPLTLTIDEGRVRFASFPLATPSGAVQLSGAFDTASGAWQSTLLAFPLDGRSYELSGPRAAPVLEPVGE